MKDSPEIVVAPVVAQVAEARLGRLAGGAVLFPDDEEELLAIGFGIDFIVLAFGDLFFVRLEDVGKAVSRGHVARQGLPLEGQKTGFVEGAGSISGPSPDPFGDVRDREDDGEDSADDEKRLDPSGLLDPVPNLHEEGAD